MNNNTNNNMHNNMNNNQVKPTPINPNPTPTAIPTPAPAKVEASQFKGIENKDKVTPGISNKVEDNGKDKKSKFIGIAILLVIVLGIFMLTNRKSNAPIVSTVAGCVEGDEFSQTTGEPCFADVIEPCKEGEEFNKQTGEPCANEESEEQTGIIVPPSSNPVTIVPATITTTTTTTTSGSSSYDAILKEYAGKSVVLSAGCSATPGTLEVPLGNKIIVANNSQTNFEVSIQGRKVTLRPFHYMMSFMGTAGEFSVSCDGKNFALVKVS